MSNNAPTFEQDSYVRYGTAQPAHSRDVSRKNRNSVLPIHLQEARDEKGRRRLHGAFTGGFSAGYYNTVGSKEGWQPQQFVSSRNARAQVTQRAEDFMDEEDLQLEKKIAAQDEFDILGGTEKELAKKKALSSAVMKETENRALGAIASSLVDDLIGPPKDSVGRRTDSGAEARGDGVCVKAKTNDCGLGFDPFKNAKEMLKVNEGRGKGGFGTGIFDEEDDDDVYGMGSKSDYSRVIEEEADIKQRDRKRGRFEREVEPEEEEKKLILVAGSKIGMDGRPALPGFIIAAADSDPFPCYCRASLNDFYVSADKRREILGEEALKGPARSAVDAADPEAAAAKRKAPLLEAVDKALAQNALKGFMPFTTDPVKQARYKGFLEWRAEVTTKEPMYPPHFTLRDIEMELTEFAKSAIMYKPLSGFMASRFTSAVSSSNTKIDEEDNGALSNIKPTKTSRSRLVFRPDRLLCKRFQVPNPYPPEKGKAAAATAITAKLNQEAEKEVLNEKSMNALKSMVETFVGAGEGEDVKKNEEMRPDVEDVYKDEPERPSMDIFKEIFADSEDEDEESEDDEKIVIPKIEIKPIPATESTSVQDLKEVPSTNTSPPSTLPPPTFRPIFARKEQRKPTKPAASKEKDSEAEAKNQVVTEPPKAASPTQPSKPLQISEWASSLQIRAAPKRPFEEPVDAEEEDDWRDASLLRKPKKKEAKEKKKKKHKRRRESGSEKEDEWVEKTSRDAGGVVEPEGPALPPHLAARKTVAVEAINPIPVAEVKKEATPAPISKGRRRPTAADYF
ncbi:hypothetical protein BC829DRAFT_450420 [Chytridium lagenaria]|nr:hypothetical protein BC829DRAFT_450420 [Chytridium lagenaria]